MRYLFIIFLLCSCSYEASNPVMPLRDYTLNTGKTFYIKGNASVEEIINVINKNYHSRGQYKVIPTNYAESLFANIAQAITTFSWVDLDFGFLTTSNSNTITISNNCFENKNIRSVILSDDITNIEPYAFADCKQLNNIRFSNRGTTIGENAFANNINLQTIILQGANNDIKDKAFVNASMINLIIEDYNNIHPNAFDNTSIINLQYNGIKTDLLNWNIKVDKLYLPKVTNRKSQGFDKPEICGTINIYINESL